MNSITLSSTSFLSGGLLPPIHKKVLCAEANINPHFKWDLHGILPAHVEYFILVVEDNVIPGTGPTGHFLHWFVDHISPTQQEILENGSWAFGTNIYPSDFPSQDSFNGWQGPCVNVGSHNFNCRVFAKIKEEYAYYVWAKPPDNRLLESNILTFVDNDNNHSPRTETGSCGTYQCPQGYVLNEQGVCTLISEAPAVPTGVLYPVIDVAGSGAWGWGGTRFYGDIDNYVFPLRATLGIVIGTPGPTDAILQDNDGTGTLLVPELVLNNLWQNYTSDINNGRLNDVGVWTSTPAIIEEWIGFSRCINVPVTKKYCVGFAADNRMRLKLNGDIIVRFDRVAALAHFTLWHVVELTLNAGLNILEIEAYNDGGPAGFGFEIYDATTTQLKALTDKTQLSLSGYVMYASSDAIGGNFDIGEVSGYICPDGYAYNVCGTGNCIDLNYENSVLIDCCWLIQNCFNQEETYMIRMSVENAIPIYFESVYEFSGGANLSDKCFKIINHIVCTTPDYENVIAITDLGKECGACLKVHALEVCFSEPTEIIYVTFETDILHMSDSIYQIDAIPNCVKYLEMVSGQEPQYENVIILQDYGINTCEICRKCLNFEDCETGDLIYVRLATGQTWPDETDIGNIYNLAGDASVINKCWKLLDFVDCNRVLENITIVKIYVCKSCSNCLKYYKLTNCLDPKDIHYIFWSTDSSPLSAGVSYTFDFLQGDCYTAELQYSPCDVKVDVVYGTENIIETYKSCEECNQPCYRLTDCETELTYTTDTDLSAYVGHTIYWYDGLVERCSLVETFICRTEILNPPPLLEILNCFDTCQECLPAESLPEEFVKPFRQINPGYTVPSCNQNNTNNCCS